jgi:hypothetical protein
MLNCYLKNGKHCKYFTQQMFYSANISLSPPKGLGPVPLIDALIYKLISPLTTHIAQLDIRTSNYYIYKVAASQLSPTNDHCD